MGMSIKDNLRRIRESKGFSQSRLSKESGVSQQLISRLENGVDITSKRLPELARALGVAVHEIDENFAGGNDPDFIELTELLRIADPDIKAAVAVLLRSRKASTPTGHPPLSSHRRRSTHKRSAQ